jgi:hypothetical protein
MANGDRGTDAGVAQRSDDAGADRCHEGIEPRARSRVHRVREEASLGAEKAQEGPMKSYLLMAITGLILCATAGVILMIMILVVSPD